MNQASDKIIDRIKKLLALAGSANENEAAAAAMKAAALLSEHNLSEADIGGIEQEGMILDGELMTDSRPWRRQLAAEVARLYFCEHFYGFVKETLHSRKCGYRRFDRHHFAGHPHNVLVAKSIFIYLCDAIDRVAIKAGNAHGSKGRAAYMTSFRHACANRLGERIRDKWYDAANPIMGGALIEDQPNTLPVLYSEEAQKVRDFLDGAAPDVTTLAEHNPKLHSIEGAIMGHAVGGVIGLDVQVEKQAAGAFMLADQSSMNKGED